MRGIGGAWKWADLRPFRLVRGLSRIPNTALPCLDPFSSPFRAQARLCSWPGATCARARGWQGISFSRVAAPRCCSSRGVHHLGMQKRRRDGRRRAFLRCLLLCAVWRLSGGLGAGLGSRVGARAGPGRHAAPFLRPKRPGKRRGSLPSRIFVLSVLVLWTRILAPKLSVSRVGVRYVRAYVLINVLCDVSTCGREWCAASNVH